MTLRSLFNIILKVLGIFFIKDVLETIPQLLSVVMYLTKSETVIDAVWTLIITLLTLLAYGLVCYYLIFKTGYVIDKLKLDKGFEQEIPLNIQRSTILSISIISIGGFFVAEELPNLCRHLYLYYLEKRMTYGQSNSGISYFVLSGVKIIIGLLLMGKQRQIVNFIERTGKK